jgi:hypothetical protein
VHCGGAEDVLQPLIHVAHPIDGGHGQHIQKYSHKGHVLAGLGEGGELLLRMINYCGLASTATRSLVSSPRHNVILQSASSFLLVSHQLFREEPGVWWRYGGQL